MSANRSTLFVSALPCNCANRPRALQLGQNLRPERRVLLASHQPGIEEVAKFAQTRCDGAVRFWTLRRSAIRDRAISRREPQAAKPLGRAAIATAPCADAPGGMGSHRNRAACGRAARPSRHRQEPRADAPGGTPLAILCKQFISCYDTSAKHKPK